MQWVKVDKPWGNGEVWFTDLGEYGFACARDTYETDQWIWFAVIEGELIESWKVGDAREETQSDFEEWYTGTRPIHRIHARHSLQRITTQERTQ